MEHLDELYETCEYLERDLAEMNKKIAASGGKLNTDTLKYLEMLTHSIKSVETTISMAEAKMNGYSDRRDNRSYDGRSYDGNFYDGMSMDGNSYGGNSYTRGRVSNAKHSNIGHYSPERGYSRDDAKKDMMKQLSDIMQNAPDERTRSELANFMNSFDRS